MRPPAASVAMRVTAERPGYFPAGGGRFFVTASPSPAFSSLHLETRGERVRWLAKAVVAALPGEIAVRELDLVANALGWSGSSIQIRQLPAEYGPGNALTLELHYEHVTEVVWACGVRGVPAEEVAEQSVQQAKEYLASEAPIGTRLAEYLVPVPALNGGGTLRCLGVSPMLLEVVRLVKQFVGREIEVRRNDARDWTVRVPSRLAGVSP